MEEINDVRYLVCHLCNQEIEEKNYNHHLDRHPSMKKLKYKCDYCVHSFCSLFSVRRHVVAKHATRFGDIKEFMKRNRKMFRCEACDKDFKDLKESEQHRKAMHSNKTGLKKETCQFCQSKTQFTPIALHSHLRKCKQNPGNVMDIKENADVFAKAKDSLMTEITVNDACVNGREFIFRPDPSKNAVVKRTIGNPSLGRVQETFKVEFDIDKFFKAGSYGITLRQILEYAMPNTLTPIPLISAVLELKTKQSARFILIDEVFYEIKEEYDVENYALFMSDGRIRYKDKIYTNWKLEEIQKDHLKNKKSTLRNKTLKATQAKTCETTDKNLICTSYEKLTSEEKLVRVTQSPSNYYLDKAFEEKKKILKEKIILSFQVFLYYAVNDELTNQAKKHMSKEKFSGIAKAHMTYYIPHIVLFVFEPKQGQLLIFDTLKTEEVEMQTTYVNRSRIWLNVLGFNDISKNIVPRVIPLDFQTGTKGFECGPLALNIAKLIIDEYEARNHADFVNSTCINWMEDFVKRKGNLEDYAVTKERELAVYKLLQANTTFHKLLFVPTRKTLQKLKNTDGILKKRKRKCYTCTDCSPRNSFKVKKEYNTHCEEGIHKVLGVWWCPYCGIKLTRHTHVHYRLCEGVKNGKLAAHSIRPRLGRQAKHIKEK